MNIFSEAFNILLYRPLFNILILLYQFLPGHDFGIAVIALTALVRILLFPVMAQTLRSQKALSEIQPKIKQIQKEFKDDQEKQMEEIMKVYQGKKINPFGTLLPLLVQLPLLIALFQVFREGLEGGGLTSLYSFIPLPQEVDYLFLGIINLSQANIPLAFLASLIQFFQLKTQGMKLKKKGSREEKTSVSPNTPKGMPYFLSAFSFVFLLRLPSALGLYWITTSLFTIGQQYILLNHDKSQRPQKS